MLQNPAAPLPPDTSCFDAIDPDKLVDLETVQIREDLPREERIADFLRQIGDPTCFRCGKLIVKLEFDEEGEALV